MKKLVYADDLKEKIEANYSMVTTEAFCDCVDAAPDVWEEVAATIMQFTRAAYKAGKEGKPLMMLNWGKKVECGEKYVSLSDVNRILNFWKSPRYRDIDGDWVDPYISGCAIGKINALPTIECGTDCEFVSKKSLLANFPAWYEKTGGAWADYIKEFPAVDIVELNEVDGK